MSREELLTKGARAAWRLLAFIAAIVVAVVYVGALDKDRAHAAAEEIVAPVRRDVADLQKWREDERALKRAISQKLDALCRATPMANCPLGD